jgi:hypothetical protein
MFGARERGFGRGFDNVDVEVFDEAQILSEKAIDDMVPATNTAANPLLFYIGTPPTPSDPSEVFKMKRAAALAGDLEDTVYIEFSADRDGDVTDHRQWAKANPSFPSRTPAAAMERMRQNLSPESFIREALGVWDEASKDSVIPNWVELADLQQPPPAIVSHHRLALDVSPDRRFAAIGAAGRRADGALQVEVAWQQPGTDWIVAKALASWQLLKIPFIVQTGSPAASFIGRFVEAGIGVVEVSQQDHARALGQVLDDAAAGKLRHINNLSLNAAVDSADVRWSGDNQVWARRTSKVNITPLVAVTLAAGAVPEPPTRGLSVFVT